MGDTYIDAKGAGPREIDLLAAQIEKRDRELPARVVGIFSDAQRRRVV